MIERALEAGWSRRRLGHAAVLIVALGLGGSMAGCADIHPAGDDSDGDMLDAPNEGAVHERDREAEAEHVQPGQERPR
jgi:hypothetical protein